LSIRDYCSIQYFIFYIQQSWNSKQTLSRITARLIGWAGILVIMYVKIFKTDDIVFIGKVMCLMSHWRCCVLPDGSPFSQLKNCGVDLSYHSNPAECNGKKKSKSTEWSKLIAHPYGAMFVKNYKVSGGYQVFFMVFNPRNINSVNNILKYQ
jgi:hypothetical protein